jgi:hypothetical protein
MQVAAELEFMELELQDLAVLAAAETGVHLMAELAQRVLLIEAAEAVADQLQDQLDHLMVDRVARA